MKGYTGNVLTVDLTAGEVGCLDLAEEICRNYVGGAGIAARLFMDRYREAFDPLAPENPLIVMTGPLCGTRLPSVPRFVVCGRSPLTGVWGESNVGGFFGPELKFAGFDGIVVEGKAASPVYLYIEDGRAEIRDASHLWGKDTYTVVDELSGALQEEGKRKAQVFTIGPAGERGVRFASITNNKHHHAGRTGMGAVMGSKNLKAIAIRGTGKVEVADTEAFNAIRKDLLSRMKENIIIAGMREGGTNSGMDAGILMGDVPIQNYSRGEWDEGYEALNAITYTEKILVGNKSCYACPVGCKREIEVTEGPYKTNRGPGPEYETVGSFGMMCLNPSIESVAKINEICNSYGIDTITAGSTMAFAIECFENGLITAEDTGGIELRWGATDAIVQMAELMGKREGFGAVLAEGSARAAEHIGKGAEAFLTTVRNMEAPMHDPRAAHGMGLSYATSVRGACHTISLNEGLEHGMSYFPELDLEGPWEEQSSEGKAFLTMKAQNIGAITNSAAIVCHLPGMTFFFNDVTAMLNSTTGLGWTMDDLMEAGDRIWNLRRSIGNLFGSTKEDDRLPARLTAPAADGPAMDSVPDMDLMLREFYELRELDAGGRPSRERLEKLGLTKIAGLLYD
jgi:aldehyde:ferredoxin oxidoreductase